MRTMASFIVTTYLLDENAPRARPAGRWCSGCRGDGLGVGGGDHSAVTSATAARADGSSTMAFLLAKAATRAWTARLFTARGSPRDTWWINAVASSLNRVSDRPASFRWWPI